MYAMAHMVRALFTLAVGFQLLFAVPLHADPVQVWSAYKLSKSNKIKFAVEIEAITGVGTSLSDILVDQILKHSMTTKIGDWYVLYNPAHELFTFVKEADAHEVAKLHVATISMAEKYLNPSDTIKHSDDRLIREFKQAQDLVLFWKYIVEKKMFRDFFDVGLSNWPPTDIDSMKASATASIYGPFIHFADQELLKCFSFILKGDSWKSQPELAELAKLDTKLLSRLAPLDFYIEDDQNISILLGDTVLSHLFASVSVTKRPTGCQPKSVFFLGLGE